MEIPFLNYHTSLLLSKIRSGQDITAHDINQAIYGSALNRLVEPYFAYDAKNTYVYRGRNTYNRRYSQIRRETPYQTYRSGFRFSRSRKRYSKYSYRKRYYRGRPLQRSRQSSQRGFRSRYQDSFYY